MLRQRNVAIKIVLRAMLHDNDFNATMLGSKSSRVTSPLVTIRHGTSRDFQPIDMSDISIHSL